MKSGESNNTKERESAMRKYKKNDEMPKRTKRQNPPNAHDRKLHVRFGDLFYTHKNDLEFIGSCSGP